MEVGTKCALPSAQPVAEDPGDEVAKSYASQHVPEGVKIIFEGAVWKLNSDGDATKAEDWRMRTMWLTDQGVLHYYSQKMSSALGRPVSGLRLAKVSNPNYAHTFAFEVHPPSLKGGGPTLAPTTLAPLAEEERDGWLVALETFREVTELAEVSTGWEPGARKRLNVFCHTYSDRVIPTLQRKKTADLRSMGRSHTSPTSGSTQSSPITSKELVQFEIPPTPPVSTDRRDSQENFADKDQTILILDWDDTLFPTTCVKEDWKLSWRRPLSHQIESEETRIAIEKLLGRLGERMSTLLRRSSALAGVVIVTLAKRPWVQVSSQHFMPGLAEVLEELQIPVIYAQEEADQRIQEEYAKDEFRSSDAMGSLWSRVKGHAIHRQVQEYYAKTEASWKNVLSFGDSDYERKGLISAAQTYKREVMSQRSRAATDTEWTIEDTDAAGHYRKLRVKTLKLLEEPTVEEMIAEAALMEQWLTFAVFKDEGFDYELESTEDDDGIKAIHEAISGQKPPEDLTWRRLGELDSLL